jgi:hypothetical protein
VLTDCLIKFKIVIIAIILQSLSLSSQLKTGLLRAVPVSQLACAFFFSYYSYLNELLVLFFFELLQSFKRASCAFV